MVYKKYIKKDGKTFGPYNYESYRNEEGKVKTRFIGPADKAVDEVTLPKIHGAVYLLLFMGIFLLVISAGFYYDKTNENHFLSEKISQLTYDISSVGHNLYATILGRAVDDTSISSTDNFATSDTSTESSVSSDTSQTSIDNSAQTPVTQTIIEVPANADQSNVPIADNIILEPPAPPVVNENSASPESQPSTETTNETISAENTTNPAGEIVGVSIGIVDEVVTSTVNATQNLINPVTNQTALNETIGAENISVNINTQITTKQYSAVIGKPVKWQKTVTIEKTILPEENANANIQVDLPSNAGDVSITKVDASTGNSQEITSQANIQNEKNVAEVQPINLVTGKVIASENGNGVITRFFNFASELFNSFISLTGKVVDDISGNSASANVSVDVQTPVANNDQVVVDYSTPAPYSEEKLVSNDEKQVTIVGPDEVHYTEVLAYAQLPSEVKDVSKIKLYWTSSDSGNKESVSFTPEDTDGNGLIDTIQWVVPHLSNQTYDIILITKAIHLDSNRNEISDIYDSVKTEDGNWSDTISDGEYVRVTFEKALDNTKDITVYAKGVSGNPSIQVYNEDGNSVIATINNVGSEGYYKTLLTNLPAGEKDYTFDLKSSGGSLAYDYIVDPSGPTVLTVTCIASCPLGPTAAAMGNYSLSATHNGHNDYTNGAYWIFYGSFGWEISSSPLDALPDYWLSIGDLTGSYIPQGSDSGTAQVSWANFAGGDGSAENPYQIANWAQLNNTRSNLTANYILIANLSSATDGYAGIGDSWVPIGDCGVGNNCNLPDISHTLQGSLNGNFNTISNLKQQFWGNTPLGLFGAVTGNISNLGLIDVDMESNGGYVGGLAGSQNAGTINNSYSGGIIFGNGLYSGGLVGQSEGTIINSYSYGTISSVEEVGGLVGGLGSGGTIINSYSTANASGSSFVVGGLVGEFYNATINDSYSTGRVSGSSRVGGLVGYNVTQEMVSNSFWDMNTSGQATSAGGTGKTTAQMKTSSTFSGVGWNIGSTQNDLNNGYPYLSWQNGRSSPTWLIYDPFALTDCGTISSPGTYTLRNNISVSGTCFTITADNVVLDGNGFNITGDGTTELASGVYVLNSSNTVIKNLAVYNFYFGIYAHNSPYTNLTNIISKNNINDGIRFESSSNNGYLENVTASNNRNGGNGVYLQDSSNLIIKNFSAINNYNGVGIQNSDSLTFDNITLTGNSNYDLFLSAPQTFICDNTLFKDYIIGSYNLGQFIKYCLFSFQSPNAKIQFLDGVSEYGNNLNNDILLNSNYVSLNSLSDFNRPAMVTLYNLPTTFVAPKIYKDSAPCNDCYNFTSLNAGTVVFNVTGWSSYSIQETAPGVSQPVIINQGGTSGGNVVRGENLTVNVTITPSIGTTIAKVWVTVWQGIIGGPILIIQYLTNLFGNFWSTVISTNITFPTGILNYTIFANTTGSALSSINGTFNISTGIAYISDCLNLNESGTTYIMKSDITTSGSCFTISADNITLDGNGHTLTGTPETDGTGISSSNANNITLKNLTIINYVHNNNNAIGINFDTVSNSLIMYVTVSNYSNGIIVAQGSGNLIRNNYLTNGTGAGQGIVIYNTQNNTILNNTINHGSDPQITISTGATLNLLEGNNLSTGYDGIDFEFDSYNNTLLNNIIYDDTSSITNTESSSGPNYLIYNNSFGEIKWTDSNFIDNYGITGALTFPGNIIIANNSAYFNSSAFAGQAINSSANITLRGLPTAFINPRIFKNGIECTDCHNFTSLNAGTVVFNVSSWSNYSIGESTNLNGCGTLSSPDKVYTLNANITGISGTCFNITANNIVIDGNGHSLGGDDIGADYGVYALGVRNITVKNFGNISNFGSYPPSAGGNIIFYNVNDSLIYNNSVLSSLSTGIGTVSGVNVNISNNLVYANGPNQGGIISDYNLNTIISGNSVNSTNTGIYCQGDGNTLVINNSVYIGSLGLGISYALSASGGIISGNSVHGGSASGSAISLESGSGNHIIVNNTLVSNANGIRSQSSPNNTITSNNISFTNGFGIYASGDAGGTVISNNIFYASLSAIGLEAGGNYSIVNNNMSGGEDGIDLSSASNNLIINNIIRNVSTTGVTLDSSSAANLLTNITVSNNSVYGISIEGNNNNVSGTFLNSGSGVDAYISGNNNRIGGSFNSSNGIVMNGTGTTLYLLSNSNFKGTGINITANNVVIDGSGYAITGSGKDGVYSVKVNNITVENFANITSFDTGIKLVYANNSLIINNTANSNTWGMGFGGGYNDVLEKNTARSNGQGGMYTSIAINATMRENTANSNSFIGIAISRSNDSLVVNNTARYNFGSIAGISVEDGSLNNLIIDNDASFNTGSSSGILLWQSSNNSVINNTLNGNDLIGVYFRGGSNNLVMGNNISLSDYGVAIEGDDAISADNNSIIENNIDSTNITGITIGSASATGNILLNNEIRNITSGYSISVLQELTPSFQLNSIVYNNSYGEIRWINSTFLNNITVIGDLVLGGTINITNGSIAVSPSLLSANPNMNSTVNLTFRNTGYHGEYPALLYNMNKAGGLCADCYNFTGLNAGTVIMNASSLGSGRIGVGKRVVSHSDVSLGSGWNMISLQMQNNNPTASINISIVPGWNLIGYSSDINLTHSSITFTNNTGSIMTISQASQRGYVQKYFGYIDNTASSKRYNYVPKDNPQLTKGEGYWVYSDSASGNLTLSGVGGSPQNETYKLSDLMFRNSTGAELNVSDALGAGWVLANNSDVNQMVYYALSSGGSTGWGTVQDGSNPDYCESNPLACSINSWQGYFINSLKSNITLLRQN